MAEHDTMMGDEPQEESQATNQSQAPRDKDGIPYCALHHCRMTSYSGRKKNDPATRYKCPVPKCGNTAKRIHSPNENVVPAAPQACPRCSTDKTGPVFCERDPESSNGAKTVLKCPDCGWKSNALVVPELAAGLMAHRKANQQVRRFDQIGDR